MKSIATYRLTGAFLLTAPLLAAPAFTHVQTAVSVQRQEGRDLLELARQQLGGQGALDAVRSLEWQQSPGTRIRVLFPNRYRTDDSLSTMLFDGSRLRWWFQGKEVSGDTSANAESVRTSGALRTVGRYAATFLLRTSDAYPDVREAGPRSFGDLTGRVLEFTSADANPPIHVILHPETGAVLGVALESVVDKAYSIQELSDYRAVDGIQFPHLVRTSRITLTGEPLPGSRPSGFTYSDIRVNSLSADIFDAGSK